MPGVNIQAEPQPGQAIRRSARNQKLLIFANLISSLGNGADTLLFGKILYDATGSVGAFETVLVSDYVFGAAANLVLGPAIDRGDPKRIIIGNDLFRAALLCALALGMAGKVPVIALLIPIYILKLGSQVFQSATFSLIPRCMPAAQLVPYASLNSGVTQSALLVGAASVGVAITFIAPAVVVAFDAATFVFCAALLMFLQEIEPPASQPKAPPAAIVYSTAGDWIAFGRVAFRESGYLTLVVLSLGNSLAVTLTNLWLAPLVAARAHDVPIYLSVFDGAFALGAICVTLVGRFAKDDRLAAYPLFAQAAAFLIIAMSSSVMLITMSFFVIGISNLLSVIFFTNRLQLWGAPRDRAKVFGLRKIINSCLAIPFLLFYGWLTRDRLALSIFSFSILLSALGLALWVLPRLKRFGQAPFYNPIHFTNPPPHQP